MCNILAKIETYFSISTCRFPEDGEKIHYKVKSVAMAVRFAVALYRLKKATRPTVKIFYATETGTAKKFTKRLVI